MVAAAGADGVLRVLSTRRSRIVAQCTLPNRDRPTRVSWSPWPRHVATAHDHGLVTVWDLEAEVPVRVLRVARGRVDAVAFSNDGRFLTTAAERRIRIYNSDGIQVRDLHVPAREAPEAGGRPLGRLNAVAFTPDDRHLLVAGDDGLVREFDVHGRLMLTWRVPSAVLALAATEEVLVLGSAAGRVSFWDWQGDLKHRADHDGSVEHVVGSADSAVFATGAKDGTGRFWDGEGTALASCALGGRLAGLGLLSDGRGLLTVTRAGGVDAWRCGSVPAPA
jgi:WD40 repeat protein